MDEQIKEWRDLSEEALKHAYERLAELDEGSDEYKRVADFISDQSKLQLKLAEDDLSCGQDIDKQNSEKKKVIVDRIFRGLELGVSAAAVIVPVVVIGKQHKYSLELLGIADHLERGEALSMSTKSTQEMLKHAIKI